MTSTLLSELKQKHGVKRFILWDTEFKVQDGGRQKPVCLVAQDAETQETRVQWYADGLRPQTLPFDTSPETVWIAYYAPAEIQTAIALSVTPPESNICLFAEHRRETNGGHGVTGNSLAGALASRGLEDLDAGWKASMQAKAQSTALFDTASRQEMILYCRSDVDHTRNLFLKMVHNLHIPQALLRGRFMKAVARIEWNGIPIDQPVYDELSSRWPDTLDRLVETVDRQYDVYHHRTFKEDRFRRLVGRHQVEWPRHETGAFRLDDDTFKDMALRYPAFENLRQLRKTIRSVGKLELDIGPDGRNRTSLHPFRSTTGRNQPASSKHVFGKAKWVRSFVKPDPGCVLVQLDWQSQEIGIAAGLSQDERLIAGYLAGDPYLAFAKDAGLAPPHATKESHPEIRNVCKIVCLGINYGMGARQLAFSIGKSEAEARELIEQHKRAYPTFWKWMEGVLNTAHIRGVIESGYGWRRIVNKDDRATSLMNFPVQANGAEMMRFAAIHATERNIEVSAPIHDAFLVHLRKDRLEQDLWQMQETMARASEFVTRGLRLRTDVKVFAHPDRYVDEGGAEMWNLIMNLAGMPGARIGV